MASKTLLFAAWEPDKAALFGGQATEARNVLPAAKGFRPCASPVLRSTLAPLPAAARGAYAVKDSSGAPQLFAGTADKIFSRGALAWEPCGSGYSLGPGQTWGFTNYGDSVLATSTPDGLQRSVLTGGVVGAFTPIADAPAAACIATVRDFVMLGRLAANQAAVRWSVIDDPTSWPAVGSNDAIAGQSDQQVFPVGGNVQAVLGRVGGADGLIFLDSAVYRALYVGSPYIFQFDPVDAMRGALAPQGVVNIGGQLAVFLAPDGWFLTDGSAVKAIGSERVDRWFFDRVDMGRVTEVRGVVDVQNHVALFSFPSSSAAEGVHDYALAYHYTLDAWSYAAITSEALFQDLSAGLSLEDLDALGSLDALGDSLDSRAFAGGALHIGLFDSAHQLASLTGLPLEATLDTGELGGARFFVSAVRPLVEGARPEIALLWRDLQGDEPQATPYAEPSDFDGLGPVEQSCRYGRVRVRIPAGSSWRIAIGADLFYTPEEG